jgi:cytochrome c oxidase subunit 3
MEAAGLPLAGTTGAVGHADDHHDHHGPPPANRSSRVEPQMLGMLLFIISEIMVFGAFFTAYFFIRVVRENAQWPADNMDLPRVIAGFNTAILVSSSFTLHWAEQCIKKDNHAGLKAGIFTTFLLGLTFLFVQINEYVHVGFAPQDHAQGTIFYGLTGLHGAHVFVGLTLLAMVTVRAFKGHFSSAEHRGVNVPGIYWHFVDVMWLVVYFTVYIL